MIPIPEYIRQYAVHKKEKANTNTFSVRCHCGGERFLVVENFFSKEEKALGKPHFDALEKLFAVCPNGGVGVTFAIDENGEGANWKLLSEDGTLLREAFVPACPFFSEIKVVKAKCAACGKEITLFDSRTCGYDGVTENHSEKCMAYEAHFKHRGKEPVKVEITVENEPSLKAFEEASGIACAESFYSNAFSWIVIRGIDESGRKKKLFEAETA